MSFFKEPPHCEYTPKFKPLFQYELPESDEPLDEDSRRIYANLQHGIVRAFNQLIIDRVTLKPNINPDDDYFGRAIHIGRDKPSAMANEGEESDVYVQPVKVVQQGYAASHWQDLSWQERDVVYELGMFVPFEGVDPLAIDSPLFAGGDPEFGSPWTANATQVGWLFLDLDGSGPNGSPTTHDLARTEHFSGILNSLTALAAIKSGQVALANSDV